MKIVLNKKPKNPIIIQGFPSLGLVSTITTKFLVDHLDIEEIGYIESEHMTPITAVHKSKVVHPITIYYNKKHNLVIIQSLTELAGQEWAVADAILKIAKDLSATEIIVVEGMPTTKEQINLYYYSNKNIKTKLTKLDEGIIMGPTAALLLRAKNFPITCIFAEAHTQFPDSEAAAKVIGALNDYTGIKVDYKPLLEAAKQFEVKLKGYIQKSRETAMVSKNVMPIQKPKSSKDDINYFG